MWNTKEELKFDLTQTISLAMHTSLPSGLKNEQGTM